MTYHVWNPEVFKSGVSATLDPVLNWWNWMETTFGLVMAACLALGLWSHRRHVAPLDQAVTRTITPGVEWTLAAVSAGASRHDSSYRGEDDPHPRA